MQLTVPEQLVYFLTMPSKRTEKNSKSSESTSVAAPDSTKTIDVRIDLGDGPLERLARKRTLQRGRYLTVKETSVAVGTGEANIRKMIRTGKLQATRTSQSEKGTYLIPIDEVRRVWPSAVLPGDDERAVEHAGPLELLLEDLLGAVLKRDHDAIAAILSRAHGGGVEFDSGRWRLALPERVVYYVSDDLARLRRAISEEDIVGLLFTRYTSPTGPLLVNALMEAGRLAEKLKPLLERGDEMLEKATG